MIHRPLLALGATALLATLTCAFPAKAQPAPTAAQPAPTAPTPLPPLSATPPGPGTAPPGGSWGTGLPGTPPPYPSQAPGYGPGAVPPGAPPQGFAPPNGAPPNNLPPPGAAPQDPYQPGTLWLSNKNDPMLMGPDGALHQLPLEMPYDKDKGIPPGYKIFEKPRYKLAITGASVLAGLWLVSCVAGGFMQADADRQNSNYYAYDSGYYGTPYQEKQAWPMFLPVIGPFIAVGTDHTDGAGTGVLIVDGLAQTAMAAMFIAGLASSEKVLKFQFQGQELALHPMAAPMTGGGFAGVQASF